MLHVSTHPVHGGQQIKLKRKEAVIEDAVILKTLWDAAINSFPWSTKNQARANREWLSGNKDKWEWGSVRSATTANCKQINKRTKPPALSWNEDSA